VSRMAQVRPIVALELAAARSRRPRNLHLSEVASEPLTTSNLRTTPDRRYNGHTLCGSAMPGGHRPRSKDARRGGCSRYCPFIPPSLLARADVRLLTAVLGTHVN
jgi:hypothetical protein